jgi:cytochrome bd-type quinol oxidase subunit 2
MRDISYLGSFGGKQFTAFPFFILSMNALTYIPVELNQIRVSYRQKTLKFPKNDNEEWQEFANVQVDLYYS